MVSSVFFDAHRHHRALSRQPQSLSSSISSNFSILSFYSGSTATEFEKLRRVVSLCETTRFHFLLGFYSELCLSIILTRSAASSPTSLPLGLSLTSDLLGFSKLLLISPRPAKYRIRGMQNIAPPFTIEVIIGWSEFPYKTPSWLTKRKH